MRGERPKVLHEICGRPMLGFVLSACRLAGVDRLVVVVGHGKSAVTERFRADRDVRWVEQAEQRGTGHAVLCCRDALSDFDGSVFVIAGDMPLVERETVSELLRLRGERGDALTMATTELPDPSGYGRIIRDDQGALLSIVEQRDCTEQQAAIREVNPSYYCFDAKKMFTALDAIGPSSATGELYLTDTVAYLHGNGGGVSAVVRVTPEHAMGINTRLDLARVSRVMQDRIQLRLMSEGVTIVDPDNAWIEADVSVGVDTTIYPYSFIGVGSSVGERCRIGPFAHICAGDTVEDGAVVEGSTTVGVMAS